MINKVLLDDAITSALNYQGMTCNCPGDECQGSCTKGLLIKALAYLRHIEGGLYEVTVSNTYIADDPADAAQQFLDNIRTPGTEWFLDVHLVDEEGVTKLPRWLVDSDDWNVEEV